MTDRKATSIRLSAEADRQLDELATALRISRSAVLELAIGQMAERQQAWKLQLALDLAAEIMERYNHLSNEQLPREEAERRWQEVLGYRERIKFLAEG
jgi:predicted DNA-binding protein